MSKRINVDTRVKVGDWFTVGLGPPMVLAKIGTHTVQLIVIHPQTVHAYDAPLEVTGLLTAGQLFTGPEFRFNLVKRLSYTEAVAHLRRIASDQLPPEVAKRVSIQVTGGL